MEIRSEESVKPKGGIALPFAEARVEFPTKSKFRLHNFFLIGASGLFGLVVLISSFFYFRYLNDPFRRLDAFPVPQYFNDYRLLKGSRFKATVRVEAMLAWQEGVGRVMLFSCDQDPRPIAVFVPIATTAGSEFTKGQVYTSEIEIKENGLIYAGIFRKN